MTPPNATQLLLLVAILILSLIAGARFYRLYIAFSNEFAKAVWTYFAASESQVATNGSPKPGA